MPQPTGLAIIQFLHEHEKPVYKAALESLAQQRKLRPVFLERKPRPEQHAWMLEQLSKKPSRALAAHALQIWLVGAHKNLLCDFLDGFEIPHDANGTVEELPEAPSKAKVLQVVESLLTRYDAGLLAIYLHAFQSADGTGWSTVEELLQEDPRLHLRQA